MARRSELVSFVALLLVAPSAHAQDDDLVADDVVVHAPSEAEELAQSSDAVRVIDTEEARDRSADVAEVLARSEGLNVRRTGGLGAPVDLCIHGVCGSGVRMFLDGVPLELAGLGVGVQGVPVGLVERIEVYRGMVPVRFGTDALGGAINVVRAASYFDPHVGASLQIGSFGTYRLTHGAGYRDDATRLYAAVQAYYDRSRNDAWMDVEVEDARGRVAPARIQRFHSAYEAYGIALEGGFVGAPFADRLLLRAFVGEHDRDIQHDVLATTPVGDATTGEVSFGALLRYQHAITDDVELDAYVGYTRRAIDLHDASDAHYDWRGRVRPRRRTAPGELGNRAFDQTIWQDALPARLNLMWRPADEHRLLLDVTPELVARTGIDREQSSVGGRDPLNAERELFTLISGLEHQMTLFGGVLENQIFVKDYVFFASAEEILTDASYVLRRREAHEIGVGEGLRVAPLEWLFVRASYEHATRLPEPDEIFGDGVLIVANLGLAPERSHNATLEVAIDLDDTPIGALRASVAGLVRARENMIVLLGDHLSFSHQNVYRALAIGGEGSVAWVSPGEWVSLSANLTYLDDRNTSYEGTFASTRGDRIPYRPWLFANFGASFRARGLFARDELAIEWRARYVHEFTRAWESNGRPDTKDVVPSQLGHDVALTYSVLGPPRVSTSVEITNLSDERLYDYFRVQRPSRAAFLKLSIEY
ncbi:TonB-dependent receptor domain-containing protein [Sandaracinus amylolyticus]|uniref:Outer membrane vitamin B12 receptor BtuB n=1 Tax=Sandaracinus amylolyticus TaxID=927083 RepID=A0A0F6W6G9_9BACT|nr:TonB-dependent receptor [Sandaracinus amylolyticus]AKF08718.1 Outer membrane vitamin B12 receptor BtuB [Sandaracinus amylolyticus]